MFSPFTYAIPSTMVKSLLPINCLITVAVSVSLTGEEEFISASSVMLLSMVVSFVGSDEAFSSA